MKDLDSRSKLAINLLERLFASLFIKTNKINCSRTIKEWFNIIELEKQTMQELQILEPAIDTAQTIRFNQLNKKTNNPIKYEKRDKGTNEVVKPEDIVKGYQYEPGQYVIVDPEDFQKVKLKSTKVIEIEDVPEEINEKSKAFT